MQETHAGWKIRILNEDIVVALEDPISELLPQGTSLSPLYPNPFSPSARLNLTLDETQHVRIVVHDLLGRAVRVLHDGELSRGVVHTFEFDGSGLPSGLYLIRVTGDRFESTRSALLVH